jgi:hypothetical protein
MTSLQLGGYDPLDAQLDDAAMASLRLPARASRLRLAGWSATSVPVASLLLVGIALGPRGISLLSPGALSLIDPALPVALAVLGVLVGLSLDVRWKEDWRPFAAALVESGFTAALVGAPLVLLAPAILTATLLPLPVLAMALGLCAASSLAVPAGSAMEPRTADRVRGFDAILSVVAGGALLGTIHAGTAAVSLVGQAAFITVLLAASAWLLLARAGMDTEQRVFAIATMLLVGGVADYLSLSALLSGLVAGMFWQLAGGQARESLRRDALYIQHSLLVLVLVIAGARTEFSLASSALASVYVFLRTAGKLLGGSVAGRIIGLADPRLFGLHLLTPGVFGVALALDAVRAGGPDLDLLLTLVVLGTIGSELVAGLGRPHEVDRPADGPSSPGEDGR